MHLQKYIILCIYFGKKDGSENIVIPVFFVRFF